MYSLWPLEKLVTQIRALCESHSESNDLSRVVALLQKARNESACIKAYLIHDILAKQNCRAMHVVLLVYRGVLCSMAEDINCSKKMIDHGQQVSLAGQLQDVLNTISTNIQNTLSFIEKYLVIDDSPKQDYSILQKRIRRLEIQQLKNTPGKETLPAPTIKTNFSVSQLALFVRLLIDTNVVEQANQSALLKWFAASFKTSKAAQISAQSLRVKYYEADKPPSMS